MRLNVRLLSILAVTGLVVAISVFFSHRWQVDRHAAGLLRRADLALEGGDPQEAISLLGRYTQQRPDDAKAYSRLALLVEAETQEPPIEPRQFHSARQLLENANRQDPTNEELRQRTVDFYLRFGRFTEAAEHLKYALQASPDDPELLFKIARAQVGSKDYDAASEILDGIVGYARGQDEFGEGSAQDAANIQAYELLAAIEREHRNNLPLADRAMDQCVSANPQSAGALLARGRYLLRHHRETPAKATQGKSDIRRAAEIAPADEEVMAIVAELEAAEGNTQAAVKWLEAGIAKHPGSDTFYRRRAALAISQNELAKARSLLSDGLEAVPESWPLLLMKAELDLASGNLEDVASAIAKLQADDQMKLMGDYLQCRVLLVEGQWRDCATQVQALMPDLMARRPDLGSQAYAALSQCYENLGETDRQRQANRQLLELQPSSFFGHFSEARALLRQGRVEQAQRSLARAKQIADAQGLQSTDLDNWETTLLAAQERSKPKQQRNLEKVERRFVAALAQREDLTPQQRTAAHARFLMQQEQFERAKELLDGSLAESPEDGSLLLGQVDFLQLTEGSEAAAAKFEQAKQIIGDSVAMRLRQGMLLVSSESEGDGLAQRLIKLEQGAEKFSPDDRVQLWHGLGNLHHSVTEEEQAARLWEKVASERPEDIAIRMQLFDLARSAQDDERMRALSNEVRQIEGPGGAFWRFTEATRLLSSAGNDPSDETLEAVGQLVDQAQQTRPNWQALSLLQADLKMRSGDTATAIDHLMLALEQGSARPTLVRRLVELLWAQQRYDEAREVMARLAESDAVNTQDMRLLSRSEVARGELAKAIQLAEQAAEDSDRAADHRWLARLYASDGQGEAAVASYRRAVNLQPENEQAHLALLRQLVASQRIEEAQAAVRAMRLQLPHHAVDSALGVAYEMLGEPLLAKMHFEQAVAARPADAAARRDLAAYYMLVKNNELALQKLDELLAIAKANSGVDARHFAWARRTKAHLIGGSGKNSDFIAAVTLLKKNGSPAMSPADLVLLSQLTLPRDDPYALEDAINAFEEAEKTRPLSPTEQLALARLHNAAGQWPACERMMTNLIAGEGNNAAVISAWCDMKLRRGDASEVERLSRQLDPESPATAQIRARLFALQDRKDRAWDVVKSLAPPQDAPNRTASLLALARFLEELEIHDKSEQLYRAIAREDASAELGLAEYLARRGKLDEAFEICETNAGRGGVVATTRIGIIGLTVAQEHMQVDGPEFQRVGNWIQEAIRDRPDSKVLQLTKIFLYELREDYATVERLYRDYLNRNLIFHERAVAANNLAMILAGQGKCAEAKRLVDEAIELVGTNIAMVDTRAMVNLCQGNSAGVDLAIEELRRAAQMSEEPIIHLHLAVALVVGGDETAAEVAFGEAIGHGLKRAQLSKFDRVYYDQLAEQFGTELTLELGRR